MFKRKKNVAQNNSSIERLEKKVEALAFEVGVLKCDGHEWEEDHDYWHDRGDWIRVECSKCGKKFVLSEVEFCEERLKKGKEDVTALKKKLEVAELDEKRRKERLG